MTEGSGSTVEDRIEQILRGLPPHEGIEVTLQRLHAVAPAARVVGVLRRLCALHPAPHVRFHAERALRAEPAAAPPVDLGEPADPARVAQALQDPDPAIRLHAIERLGELHATEAGPLLIRAINRPEEDPWVLATLISALGLVGGEGAPEEASLLLDHPSPRVAANALQALFQLEPETAVFAAHYRLSSDDNRLRANALQALYRDDPDLAWSMVREMVAHDDEWMRASGCWLAASLGHADSERLLLELMAVEKSPEIQVRILRALGRAGSPGSIGALAAWSRSPEAVLAREASEALEELRLRLGLGEHELAERAAAAARTWTEARVVEDHQRQVEEVVPSGLMPAVGTPFQPAPGVEGAIQLMEAGRNRDAIRHLQALLPDGGAVPVELRWALTIAFLRARDVGPALRTLRGLDPVELTLAQAYVLGRNLEEVGAVKSAVEVFEAIEARRLGFRDVETRLSALKLGSASVPEQVWMSLADRYVDLVPLARGGMAQIFRAVERTSGRPVAIKVPDERILEDATSRARFVREIETLATLEHPHVVKVYDVSTGEVPYYSMELVGGTNLEECLARTPRMDPLPTLELLTPIAAALAHVHARGIIHRDVKPANILLDPHGSPRLGDFGIAHLDGRKGVTTTGTMVGTMSYMAPEQLAGYPPTPSVDVYAFGVVLFRTLTGGLPFPSENAVLKVYRDPPDPLELRPDLPGPLAALIRELLAREPGSRPGTGGELLMRLEAVRAALGPRRVGEP